MNWEEARIYTTNQKLRMKSVWSLVEGFLALIRLQSDINGKFVVATIALSAKQTSDIRLPNNWGDDSSSLYNLVYHRLYCHIIAEIHYETGYILRPDKTQACHWVWTLYNPDGEIVNVPKTGEDE